MNIMKIAGIIISTLLGLWVILSIARVWGDVISWSNYIKVTITMALLALAVGIIALIIREFIKESDMKKDDFID
jgi:membrane protein implicated in regulation of membrane protease activity